MGILNDDLALSDDEDDEMPSQQMVHDSDLDSYDGQFLLIFQHVKYNIISDEATRDNFANLAASNMSAAGQLSTDLALSSSSDVDADIISAKRPRLDDYF